MLWLGTKLKFFVCAFCSVFILLSAGTANAVPMMMDFVGTAQDNKKVEIWLLYDPSVEPFRLTDSTEQISNTGMILRYDGREFTTPFVSFFQTDGPGIDNSDVISYSARLTSLSGLGAVISFTASAQPNFDLIQPNEPFTNTGLLLSSNVFSATFLTITKGLTDVFTSTITISEISNKVVNDVSEPLSLFLFAIALAAIGLFARRRARA